MNNRWFSAPTPRRFLDEARATALLPGLGTGADRDGRVAADWSVCGLPDKFVVSADGRIVHKHIGPVTSRDLDDTILPLIASLRRGRSGSADALDDPAAEAGRKP